jgi:predicted PurR-regulated permease PerM
LAFAPWRVSCLFSADAVPAADAGRCSGTALRLARLSGPDGRYKSMVTARKAFLATTVGIGVVAVALALWRIRSVIALLFFALTISAAIRPGVEWLAARRVPRAAGVLLHYLALLGVIGLLLWLIVPQAISEVQQALGGSSAHAQLKHAEAHTNGLEHDFLLALDRQLRHLPSGAALIHPALSVTTTALKVLAAFFFAFAVAAYWIFERAWAEELVLSLAPPRYRKVTRDTWHLIDEKLGAFVRGQLLMIGFVSTVLSGAFWALGLPYWLLLGVFAGIVEMIPVIGPLAAGGLAVAVALTQGWETALLAAIAVYGLRLLQDYLINPHVLGHAVGLSPLIVLVTVSIVAVLFGPFYVTLSVPLAAVLATLVDVFVRDRNPARERVPTVIFPAKEREVS